MKKNLGLLLIALVMITVLFVSVSCNEGPTPEPEPTTATLTLDTQGGVKMKAITVNIGSSIKKSKVGTPTYTGYKFLGWYTDTTWATEVTFPIVMDKDITIYAHWINQTVYEHSDPILPEGSVRLNGYKFTIPLTWSEDLRGIKNLPDVTYSFAGERTSVTNVSNALKEAIATAQNTEGFFDEEPTNVIFLFSDGWGVTEVNMSREYKGELIMDYLPYATESKTDSYKKYKFDGSVDGDYSSHETTDSCAGGTQVLSGYKTRYGYIALDVDGNPIDNMIEAAHSRGWKTAVVTNDNIVDATPADAMIHDTNRYHSDVLYYKALRYALVRDQLDLLMGWDWGMSTYFNTKKTWAEKFLEAEKEGIEDGIEEMDIETTYDGGDPIAYFKRLSTEDKAAIAGFSIYYHLWESETGKTNSCLNWTKDTADLNQYIAWLGNGGTGTGLAKAIKKVEEQFGNPADYVSRFTKFETLVENTDLSKPILGSWTSDGEGYDSDYANRGYLLNGEIGMLYPSWPEMVAYTIYQLDQEADAAQTGFFCLIENTCTDGWGHSKNSNTKVYSMMNEVQCFDEGVAIAVKYVLEHPDTLLVVSADHETGGFVLQSGWEDDFTKIASTTTGHSSQRVPLYAFGAGAKNFSAEEILKKYGSDAKAGLEQDGKIHEGWITGQIMGELITGEDFGEDTATYHGEAIDHGKKDDPYGAPLWDPPHKNEE